MITSTDGANEMIDVMGSYSFLGELTAQEYTELKEEINAPWPDEEQ